MREIGHFIGGKTVAGGSGRSGDVFDPNTGEVQAKVAFASKSEVEQAIANADAAQPAWAATNPQRRARVMFKFLELVQKEFDSLAAAALLRARQDLRRFQGRHPARAGSRRVRLRHPAPPQGRVQRQRRPRHRPVLAAPAAGRRRRHHAVQLPGHDPDVEIRARARLRQRLHSQAVGARPFGADAARRAPGRGRAAGGRAQRRQRRQGGGRCAAGRSAHPRDRLRRLIRDRRIHLQHRLRATENACSASAAPRTT